MLCYVMLCYVMLCYVNSKLYLNTPTVYILKCKKYDDYSDNNQKSMAVTMHFLIDYNNIELVHETGRRKCLHGYFF